MNKILCIEQMRHGTPESSNGGDTRIAPPLEVVLLFPHNPNRKGASVSTPDLPRKALREDGLAAIEFALVAPVLLLILVGMAQFGLTVNNYVTLTNAVTAGARQFAMSRGGATPKTDTVNRITGSAPNLTQASLTISLSVNGTACTTDTACSTALQVGLPATVSGSYPCSLVVVGIDFAPSCSLTAQTTERVE